MGFYYILFGDILAWMVKYLGPYIGFDPVYANALHRYLIIKWSITAMIWITLDMIRVNKKIKRDYSDLE